MKPKITFQEGSRLLVVDSREFTEPPPINQELEIHDLRYKVVGYESVVVNVEPVPDAPEEKQRQTKRTPHAKRVAKKQAKVAFKASRAEAKAKAKGKPAASDKVVQTHRGR
jgi:hypothetical protein